MRDPGGRAGHRRSAPLTGRKRLWRPFTAGLDLPVTAVAPGAVVTPDQRALAHRAWSHAASMAAVPDASTARRGYRGERLVANLAVLVGIGQQPHLARPAHGPAHDRLLAAREARDAARTDLAAL